MVVIGVGLGLVGALLITRVLRTLLFGVSVMDPFVIVTTVLVMAVTAWIAAYVPARRAARLDPLLTLRSE